MTGLASKRALVARWRVFQNVNAARGSETAYNTTEKNARAEKKEMLNAGFVHREKKKCFIFKHSTIRQYSASHAGVILSVDIHLAKKEPFEGRSLFSLKGTMYESRQQLFLKVVYRFFWRVRTAEEKREFCAADIYI